MVKKLNADQVATKTTEAMQPVIDFRIGVVPNDPRQAAPTKTPLPADLARALGQTER
ncbi:beta-lactamase class A [Bradyrhizobium sp. USDA 4341]